MYFIRYILWFFYDKLTKEVKPVPGDIKMVAGQWHLLHFAISYIPISLLLKYGFPQDYIFIPCIILTIIFLITELKQVKGQWNNSIEVKDLIADNVLYQGCWAAGYDYPLIVIVILYIIFLKKGWLKP